MKSLSPMNEPSRTHLLYFCLGASEITTIEIEQHSEYTPKSQENEIALHKWRLFRPHSSLKYIWCIITEEEEYVECVEPNSICLRQQNTRRSSTAAATFWWTTSYFEGLSAAFRSPSVFCGMKGRGARNLSSPPRCHIIGKLLNWYLCCLVEQVCWCILVLAR